MAGSLQGEDQGKVQDGGRSHSTAGVKGRPLMSIRRGCGGKGIESDRSYTLKCWGQVLCGQSMES